MGSAIDILTKRNYFGELLTIPENAKAEFLTTITPFWMEFEMEDNALLPQVTMHPAELLGFRNWSVQQYEILNEGLDKATAKWCKDNGYPAMTWKEADTNNKYIQMEVLKANPDLVKAQEESWEHWAKNNPDDKSVLYKQASEFAQLTYVNELERVSQMLLDGKITVREWRDKLSDAGTAYGGALTSLQEEYKGVFAKWDEYKRDVPELSFNEAYYDYIERVIAPTFLDVNGDFSWDKKEEARRTFVAEWGMDTVRKIEEIFDYNRGTPELVKIKKNLQDRLKPYWDIRPEGYNAAERRENLRRTDPFIDAALTFLGYVSMPLTNDGDIVLDSLVNITGVPYDSIYGEGTTPEILKLLRGYESLETQEEKRQFRRENPSLEIWGVNNRGWKSIKQQDKEAGYVD